MEIKNNEKIIDSLVINKVPSRKIYNQMVKQGKINNDEIYIINKEDDLPYKYNFIAQEGDSSFTFPFTVENPEDLNIFFNGLLMTKDINYTIQNNQIILIDFTTEANDNITILNIRGVEPENYSSNLVADLQAIKNTAITEIDQKLAQLPEDMNELLRTTKNNIMSTNSKITMDSSYSPIATGDITTKKYVDQQIQNNKISKVSQLTNDAGYLTSHLVESVNGMTGDVSIKGAYMDVYYGGGTTSKTFTFNFEPAYIVIIGTNQSNNATNSMLIGLNGMKYPWCTTNIGTYISFNWSSNSVTFTATSTASAYLAPFNYSGYKYYYMAIPKFNN